MSASGEKFAQLLTEAIYHIRSLESKSVQIIQDELGYAIGKRGGASIEYWRKGSVPSKFTDVENLARELIQRTDLDENWLQQFLLSANYPHTVQLYNEIFAATTLKTAVLSPSPELTPHKQSNTQTGVEPPLFYNNLPPQPTSFVGRETALQQIIDHVADTECQLLTLTGPGGIGKTRLAIQAASNIFTGITGYSPQHLFANGICFVSLASLNSADFLVSTIADALDFTFFSGEDTEDQLLSFLRDKKLLLVIDNLEHLIQGAPLLGNILLRASGVKIIATSRERLNLRGEWVMELQGMRYPDETAVFPVPPMDSGKLPPNLQDYSAVQLFIHNAIRVDTTFAPTQSDLAAIVQICRLVRGIPLAIELAATWARTLSCREIAEEIERNYDFLATTLRDMPERHRSLQAVFDYSWNLLSAKERDAIRRLSVFHGGFQRSAAASIAGASLHLLSALIDKSFLYMKRRGRAARYEMHDLLRQYASNKLNQEAEETQTTRQQHALYFGQFLANRVEDLKGGKQIATLSEIGHEVENLRAGWANALQTGQAPLLDQYVDGLFYFYDISSWVHEGDEVFATAAIKVNLMLDAQKTAVVEQLLGRLFARQGRFQHRLGFYTQARHLLQQGLSFAQKYDDSRELAFAYNNLGNVMYRLGEHQAAREICQKCIALCETHNYQWELAEALKIMGDVAEVRGMYEEAKQLHQRGWEISQALGDRRGIAISLNRLGYIDWHLGEYEEANLRCRESLAICKEVGDRRGIAMSYKNLGNVASDIGDYDRANKHYQSGLKISHEIGDRWGVAVFNNNMGNLAWETGDYEEARELCLKSLSIWRPMGYQLGMAVSLETLGSVATAMNAIQEAREYFQEALRIALDIKATPLALDVLSGLASILAKDGDIARAVEILTFIFNQPAMDQEARDKTERRLQELMPLLSKDVFAAAQTKGKTESFAQVVEEMQLIG